MESGSWRKCSTCKKPIEFGQTYWICNVSTCNQRKNNFVFCQVPCWDAHLPVMNHREAWAVEKKAPSKNAWENELAEATKKEQVKMSKPTKVEAAPASTQSVGSGDVPRDVLIVASKLKVYVKAKSGMNTSGEVLEALSDAVRGLTDEAILRAEQSGRKTVMARDYTSD